MEEKIMIKEKYWNEARKKALALMTAYAIFFYLGILIALKSHGIGYTIFIWIIGYLMILIGKPK